MDATKTPSQQETEMAQRLTDDQVTELMGCEDWTESDRADAQEMVDALGLCGDCGGTHCTGSGDCPESDL